jgi:hypothetical protein
MSTPPSPAPPSDRLSDYFKYLAAISPAAQRVWAAPGEAELDAAVGEALEHAVKLAQADGARELLSRRLVHLLSAAGIPCGAEEGQDGRVTVTVKHPAELAFTARRSLGSR